LSQHLHEEGGHAREGGGDERRIMGAFLVIALFFLVELVGGIVSGSLALLADAGHMISDAAALGFSWWALRIGRRAASDEFSYGYRRYEILAAFINGLALFAIAAWILIEAVRRFADPVPVLGGTMLAVAIGGLAANISAFFILNGGSRENLNMRSALLHVLGDLLGSGAAIVAATVIMLTGWTPIDPLLSVFVALIILRSAWRVVRDSGRILLEGVPDGLSIALIKADLENNVPGVRNAHHIHAWSITGREVRHFPCHHRSKRRHSLKPVAIKAARCLNAGTATSTSTGTAFARGRRE
jgi:cobalt-zinc-cadmium efflux system protein